MDLWDYLPVGWQDALSQVRSQIDAIDLQLRNIESQGILVNPARESVFVSLGQAPESARVVIVGQDPYPNPEHATGLAFSVPAGTNPLPPTLRNILKELRDDVSNSKTDSGDLSRWCDEGVLLLNRILTVTSGESLSHKDFGWQEVTDAILDSIVALHPDVIGVLWGNYAQECAHFFKPENLVSSVHPSPLSAHRGFLGSHPFSRVNQILTQKGQPAIDW